MHPRDIPEAFSPFYSTKQGGIGIGLAITKRILNVHSSKIAIASHQGNGTEVTILFPTQH